MNSGIYKITNLLNQKVYIGQSVNVVRRLNEHKRMKDLTQKIDQAIEESRPENFKFEIVEICDVSLLNERERYWINFYDCVYPKGYNMKHGGQAPCLNRLRSFQQISEIIDLLRTTKLTNSEIGDIYGVSDQAISDINTGRSWVQSGIEYPIRKQTKRVCLNSAQYMPTKEDLINAYKDTKTVIGAANKLNIGKTTYYRYLRNYGLPSTGKELKEWLFPKEPINKKSKRVVLQFTEDGQLLHEYESTRDAGRALGNEDYRKHIMDVCNGKRLTAYGYKWQYKEIED